MKKVLVVDDSKTILSLIRRDFKKSVNAEIFYAESYKEAVNIIRRNPHEIKVALVDLHLPDAPSAQIVQLMSSNSIPAIVLTGSDDPNLKEIILKKRVVDYILKNNPSSILYASKIINRILSNYDTTILVVDDSKASLINLIQTLEPLNLNVLSASNGEEALEILKNSDKKISLIVTDYTMPIMNGMELTMKVRQMYSKDELAIIVMSSTGANSTIGDFFKSGGK